MTKHKNILVAPLNWGLGHATRCIPIINELINNNYTPVLASDGDALDLLKKEFPDLKHIELPSYNITYAKKRRNFKAKMILNSPSIFLAIVRENRALKKIIKKHNISGIISDNRFGLFSKTTPSVFISHQLNVLSGFTTKLSSKIHQYIISKYSICWVPDLEKKPNLSGHLGHLKNSNLNIKYIGPLSRFNKKQVPLKNDYLVLLSGPEPQRSLLEDKLFKELKKSDKKIVFVRGKVEEKQQRSEFENITIYNYMTSVDLQNAINESDLIIARSGYTTIMDLAKLEKKAFFVPTPGQLEQEYLAKRLKNDDIAPYSSQDSFKYDDLKTIENYAGFKSFNNSLNLSSLFSVFEKDKNYSSDDSLAFSSVKENSEPTPNSLST